MAKLTRDQLPLEDLKKLGITVEILEKTKNLDKILSGAKTDLLNIRGKLPGLELSGQAKLFVPAKEKKKAAKKSISRESNK